jgi:uncharacterized protein
MGTKKKQTMKIKWRKWNRIIHRDLGYFFFGMTIIYAVSGIAINHIDDWNPNFSVEYQQIAVDLPQEKSQITEEAVLNMLEIFGEKENYKKHFFPNSSRMKIFLKGGNIDIDLSSGSGLIEKKDKRQFLHQVNYLHYNPINWWTIFSDMYVIGLFLLAVSGLFIIRGKKGITGRGAWLTAIGIGIPIIYLIIFY